MIAMIHEGEAVVPKKFNPYANGIDSTRISSMQNTYNPMFRKIGLGLRNL